MDRLINFLPARATVHHPGGRSMPVSRPRSSYEASRDAFLDEPKIQSRITTTILMLHAELLAGTLGEPLLGIIGLAFVASIISGVVLYGPWTRELDFKTIRRNGQRLRCRDRVVAHR